MPVLAAGGRARAAAVAADLPNVPTLLLGGDKDLSHPARMGAQAAAAHAPAASWSSSRATATACQGAGLAAAKALGRRPRPRSVAAVIDDLIRSRRTHKAFGPEPVPRETLLELFELARWAPNHHLTDPWRFRVLGPAVARRR